MKRLTILIDFDQTINDLASAWVEYLNERHGTSVKTEDLKEWDMRKAFPNLTESEIYKPLKEEAMWDKVKLLPKVYDNICKLKYDGHKVFVVTTSNPFTVPIKLNKVLFKYFPFFTYNDVIVTSHKQMILGDVLVDDGQHNLVGDTPYKKILFSAPHNKSFDERSIGAVRANDWDEVYELITEFAAETRINTYIKEKNDE